jgi:hypothetical protein
MAWGLEEWATIRSALQSPFVAIRLFVDRNVKWDRRTIHTSTLILDCGGDPATTKGTFRYGIY